MADIFFFELNYNMADAQFKKKMADINSAYIFSNINN